MSELAELSNEAEIPAFLVDDRHRIAAWNRRCEEVFGRPSAEVVGRKLDEILEARDLQGNLVCMSCCGLREMARRGEPIRPFLVKIRDASNALIRQLILIEAVPGGEHGKCQLLFRLSPDRRASLSGPRSEALVKNGRVLSYPRAAGNGVGTNGGSLTPRQREVLWLLADGRSTAQIAEQLGISVNTVRNHEQNILRRLGTHTQAGAVAAALRQHLI